jgi:DNA helicase HerA-like ATPase
MTKMGKSTFATRLASELAKTRRVTILDQTGEYVSKKGLPAFDNNIDWTTPGISVFEPKPGEVAADRALAFLDFLIKQAVEEYKVGTPFSRVVVIDEAHQFIPEPAGLTFNAPGRDSSFKIGLLLMQIRKYGISVILISQRTAVVAKSALSQCENLICFRSVDQTGLDYLEAIAGGDFRSILPQLGQGEALVFGPAITSDSPVALQVDR